MSTEYDPVLILGADLDVLFNNFQVSNPDTYEDKWDYRDAEIHNDGMVGEFVCGYVGFELPLVVKSEDWFEFQEKVADLGQRFKELTGVTGVMKACVQTY